MNGPPMTGRSPGRREAQSDQKANGSKKPRRGFEVVRRSNRKSDHGRDQRYRHEPFADGRGRGTVCRPRAAGIMLVRNHWHTVDAAGCRLRHILKVERGGCHGRKIGILLVATRVPRDFRVLAAKAERSWGPGDC